MFFKLWKYFAISFVIVVVEVMIAAHFFLIDGIQSLSTPNRPWEETVCVFSAVTSLAISIIYILLEKQKEKRHNG